MDSEKNSAGESTSNAEVIASALADLNEVLASEGSALGVNAIAVVIPAAVVYDFKKLWDWKFRGIAEKSRPMSLEGFITDQLRSDGTAHAKYAEDSAYRLVEKLVFDTAKLQKISPQEAAAKIGVQLREK